MDDFFSVPESEFQMPEGADNLFKSHGADYRYTAMVKSGIDKLFLFSEGYKLAAKRLFDTIDGNAYDVNLLVYPLVYINRQFIELRLKELISGLNFVINKEYKFPNGHNIYYLWNDYKNLVLSMDSHYHPEASLILIVDRLISEFSGVDPSSYSFRYPVDTSNDRLPTLTMDNLDLLNFVEIMQKLYNFFDMQSDMVFHLIDETEAMTDYVNSVYRQEMNSQYGL